jgi:predicted transposase YbfD/YdcC
LFELNHQKISDSIKFLIIGWRAAKRERKRVIVCLPEEGVRRGTQQKCGSARLMSSLFSDVSIILFAFLHHRQREPKQTRRKKKKKKTYLSRVNVSAESSKKNVENKQSIEISERLIHFSSSQAFRPEKSWFITDQRAKHTEAHTDTHGKRGDKPCDR